MKVSGIDTIHAIERDQSKERQRSQVRSSQRGRCIAHAMSNDLESGIQSYNLITNNRKIHSLPVEIIVKYQNRDSLTLMATP